MQDWQMQQYLDMMNQWLILKQQGKSIAFFLIEQGLNTAAVYGMGIYGRHVVRELKGTDCIVKCGIDRKEMDDYMGLRIVRPKEKLPEVDVVINAVIHEHSLIVQNLQQFLSCPVISLEDVIYGSY